MKSTSRALRTIAILVSSTGLIGAKPAFAQGQSINTLSVMPTRVTLDDSNRACTFTLLNRGSKSVRYRLVLREMRMSESGVLEPAESYDHSAAALLKFAPREVLIEPGQWQKIKVVEMIPNELSDGEYRSHLAFEPVDVADPADANNPNSNSKLKLQFKVQTALSVPVFVRHGNLTGNASITGISIGKEDSKAGISVVLRREGDRTIRGACTVSFVPSNSSTKLSLGRIEELPIYFPNITRTVFIPFETGTIQGKSGDIVVEFTEPGGHAVQGRLHLPAER